MRNFLISFLLAAVIVIPTEIFAADYETPHEFSAGDTLSADMMNELFEYIKMSKQMITASELVGTWSCIFYSPTSACHSGTLGTDSIYYNKTGTIIMSDDGDGTYTYTIADRNYFRCNDSSAGSGKWYVKNNMLFTGVSMGGTYDTISVIRLRKISKSKILFENMIHNQNNALFAECDKQNLPPSTPVTLTASTSEKTVSLAWTDNSTDETGFKVLRKDSLTGSYSTITTTSADATSYSDTVTDAGSYWYRVSATNSNGDSVASKMVKVDVE